jgi:replicative DNA helicase
MSARKEEQDGIMANTTNAILQDSGIERSVLAGVATYGADCFFEVEEIIGIKDFYWTYNQELFKILSYLVHEDDAKTFDTPSVQATAKILGYTDFASGGKYTEYLEDVMAETSPSKDNIYALVAVLYKLSLARQGYLATAAIQKELKKITGAETIDEIIGHIEEPIFDFTGSVMDQGSTIVSLGKQFENSMKALEKTPQDIVGLPTGFPTWDTAIGGGFRQATVNIVGARQKQGKSFFCMNVAKNMAENGIPVLYLDTELTNMLQLHRLTSLVSGIELEHIETGKFGANHHESDAVWSCKEHMENLKIDHFSVAGMSPHAIMSIARRWLSRTVGFTDTGAAKPCLIIYDYIKLMDDSGFKHNLQEFQLLGFLTTALHNFATKFMLPVLATVQLNRDGVEKEGAEVISGSDRIGWLCSNFTILKPKTQTELNEDPPSNGTKKLIVTDTRNGPGMEHGEYINIIADLSISKFSEGKPFSAITQCALENQAHEEV